MTTSETATDERWHVQLDSREVKLMTLDELDDAFQQGLIHENTFLIKVGEQKWQTLAETLGSDEDDEAVAEPEPMPAPAAVSGFQAARAGSIPGRAPAHDPSTLTLWPPPASTPARGGGWPPSVAPTTGYAPVTAASVVPQQQGPRSTAPVVQDLSDLDLDPPFKRSRRGLWLFAAAAVALAAGGGFALQRLDAPPPAAAAAPAMTAAAALTPFRSPPPEPKAAPTPPPAPEAAKSEPTSAKPTDTRFSDDMKKALLAADEGRAQKKTARSAATRRVSAKSKSTKTRTKGTGFKGSGSKHDPLDPTL